MAQHMLDKFGLVSAVPLPRHWTYKVSATHHIRASLSLSLPSPTCVVHLTSPCLFNMHTPAGLQKTIAVNKDNPGLTEAINGALAELEEEGYISELEVKWLGAEL